MGQRGSSSKPRSILRNTFGGSPIEGWPPGRTHPPAILEMYASSRAD